MEKKRKIKVLTTMFLVAAVLGLTVAFASLTQLLTITGTASSGKSSFDVYFENITNETLNASFTKEPTITSKTNIDYEVKMNGTASSATVKFDVKNNSTFDVDLSELTIGTPTCASTVDTGVSVENFCNALSYTLVYDNNGSSENVEQGKLTIPAGESKHMTLKLSYNITDASNLPADDVTITNLGVSMNFMQK